MTYNDFVTAIAKLLAYQIQTVLTVVSSTDVDFNAAFPRLIEYAEQRIHRDLDTLPTHKILTGVTLTANTRTLTAPADLLIATAVNVVVPVTAATPDAGKRKSLRRVSFEFLEEIWPQASMKLGVPEYYANLDNTTFVVAPTPDQAYPIEWRYVFRPTALSTSNTTTYLSTTYPDLMVAAGMVWGSGYMRNFGSQADDPKMALSWEGQYQSLLASAKNEAQRTKAEADLGLSPSTVPPQVP